MVIEIPDNIFDLEMKAMFEKMAPENNTKPGSYVKSLPVLHRIAYELKHNDKKLCVVMTMFYRAVFRELGRRNIIIYKPDTDTWQGVDYDGD